MLKRTFDNWHQPTLLTLTYLPLSILYMLTVDRFIIISLIRQVGSNKKKCK